MPISEGLVLQWAYLVIRKQYSLLTCNSEAHSVIEGLSKLLQSLYPFIIIFFSDIKQFSSLQSYIRVTVHAV